MENDQVKQMIKGQWTVLSGSWRGKLFISDGMLGLAGQVQYTNPSVTQVRNLKNLKLQYDQKCYFFYFFDPVRGQQFQCMLNLQNQTMNGSSQLKGTYQPFYAQKINFQQIYQINFDYLQKYLKQKNAFISLFIDNTLVINFSIFHLLYFLQKHSQNKYLLKAKIGIYKKKLEIRLDYKYLSTYQDIVSKYTKDKSISEINMSIISSQTQFKISDIIKDMFIQFKKIQDQISNLQEISENIEHLETYQSIKKLKGNSGLYMQFLRQSSNKIKQYQKQKSLSDATRDSSKNNSQTSSSKNKNNTQNKSKITPTSGFSMSTIDSSTFDSSSIICPQCNMTIISKQQEDNEQKLNHNAKNFRSQIVVAKQGKSKVELYKNDQNQKNSLKVNGKSEYKSLIQLQQNNLSNKNEYVAGNSKLSKPKTDNYYSKFNISTQYQKEQNKLEQIQNSHLSNPFESFNQDHSQLSLHKQQKQQIYLQNNYSKIQKEHQTIKQKQKIVNKNIDVHFPATLKNKYEKKNNNQDFYENQHTTQIKKIYKNQDSLSPGQQSQQLKQSFNQNDHSKLKQEYSNYLTHEIKSYQLYNVPIKYPVPKSYCSIKSEKDFMLQQQFDYQNANMYKKKNKKSQNIKEVQSLDYSKNDLWKNDHSYYHNFTKHQNLQAKAQKPSQGSKRDEIEQRHNKRMKQKNRIEEIKKKQIQIKLLKGPIKIDISQMIQWRNQLPQFQRQKADKILGDIDLSKISKKSQQAVSKITAKINLLEIDHLHQVRFLMKILNNNRLQLLVTYEQNRNRQQFSLKLIKKQKIVQRELFYQFIQTKWDNLILLNLSENNLTYQMFQQLCRSITDQFPSLNKLHLNKCNLSKIVEQDLKTLNYSQTIRQIQLLNNPFKKQNISMLAKAQLIQLYNFDIRYDYSIFEMKNKNNISQFIHGSNDYSISLANSQISFQKIIDYHENITYKNIRQKFFNINSIDLSNNKYGDSDLQCLFKNLPKFKFIRFINLSHNQINNITLQNFRFILKELGQTNNPHQKIKIVIQNKYLTPESIKIISFIQFYIKQIKVKFVKDNNNELIDFLEKFKGYDKLQYLKETLDYTIQILLLDLNKANQNKFSNQIQPLIWPIQKIRNILKNKQPNKYKQILQQAFKRHQLNYKVNSQTKKKIQPILLKILSDTQNKQIKSLPPSNKSQIGLIDSLRNYIKSQFNELLNWNMQMSQFILNQSSKKVINTIIKITRFERFYQMSPKQIQTVLSYLCQQIKKNQLEEYQKNKIKQKFHQLLFDYKQDNTLRYYKFLLSKIIKKTQKTTNKIIQVLSQKQIRDNAKKYFIQYIQTQFLRQNFMQISQLIRSKDNSIKLFSLIKSLLRVLTNYIIQNTNNFDKLSLQILDQNLNQKPLSKTKSSIIESDQQIKAYNKQIRKTVLQKLKEFNQRHQKVSLSIYKNNLDQINNQIQIFCIVFDQLLQTNKFKIQMPKQTKPNQFSKIKQQTNYNSKVQKQKQTIKQQTPKTKPKPKNFGQSLIQFGGDLYQATKKLIIGTLFN